MARWASQNAQAAISSIVLLEGLKFGIGFYLGKSAFPAMPKAFIELLVIAVGLFIAIVQKNYGIFIAHEAKNHRYERVLKGNTLVFLSTLFLSILIGNLQQKLHTPTLDTEVKASLSVENTQKINADSLFVSIEKNQVGQPSPVQIENDTITTADDSEKPKTDTLRRVLYFLLFAVSLVATFYAIVFACSLSCSGYAVWAVLVILVGLGVFGSGFYFLTKIFRKGYIKQWKEMDKTERKKERKRYIKTALISALALVGFVAIMNLLE